MALSAALVRKFGELAPDVAFLRDCGHLVAPFKGGFRIDNEVIDAAGITARAEAKRESRRLKEAAPHTNGHAAEAAAGDCKCGRPSNHHGRCWFRRGLDGPPVKTARAPKVKETKPPPVKPARKAARPRKAATTDNPIDAALDRLRAELVRIQGAIVALEMAKEVLDR